MSKEDVQQAAELEAMTFSQPWTKEAFAASIDKTENIYIVAEKDKKIIGYCGMWGVAGEGQINNVAIHPDFRKQGIGYEMLQYAMEKAIEKKITTFTLEVRKSNVAALNLYRKLGFSSAGVRKNFYQFPTEDAVIMWKL